MAADAVDSQPTTSSLFEAFPDAVLAGAASEDVRVYRGKEHEEIEVPAELLLSGANLDILEEVRKRNFFQVRFTHGKFVFQTGPFVGLIPLNAKVAIEVVPKLPIANLERLLRLGGAVPETIPVLKVRYGPHEEAPPLSDLLCDSMVEAIDRISLSGRLKTYQQHHHVGVVPRGRLLVSDTVRLRSRGASASPQVCSSRFDRVVDNAQNRFIKLAVLRLASVIRSHEQKGSRRRLAELNRVYRMFDDVRTVVANPTDVVQQIARAVAALPENRDYYRQALGVSATVLGSVGVASPISGVDFKLGSLLYDLGKVFERYCFKALKKAAQPELVSVLDGNEGEPEGAKCDLFEDGLPATRKMKATPDVVLIRRADGSNVVLDAKYKVCTGAPERSDLEQVLTYGARFTSTAVGLIYPASAGIHGLVSFGRVGSTKVVGYGINLSSGEMDEEDRRMATALVNLALNP